jgi:phosphinothricin acetyltransferase
MTTPGWRLRPAEDGDLQQVQAIYAHHVLHGVASFELRPPDTAEIAQRRQAIVERGLPYLVAVDDSGGGARVLGYAYASPYRARPAYRLTLEDSVYIAHAQAGRGIGGALLGELIAQTTALGYRQMVAVIGDSGNAASIALHRRHGFREAGTLLAVGWKHGRWIDSVLMQRALGAGDSLPA